MKGKRRVWLCLVLALLVVLCSALALVACNNDTPTDVDDGEEQVPEQKVTDINGYLRTVNSGLKKTKDTFEGDTPLVEYAVNATYTVYTEKCENYTIDYQAVYSTNAQRNLYYIKLFDNDNHITRAELYFDSNDLYIVSGEKRYVISDFNSLLLYSVFDLYAKKLDIKELIYSDFMTEYFNEYSLLVNVFGVEDCKKTSVEARKQAVSFTNGDISLLVSVINAAKEAKTENIGTSFDAISNHYFGFKVSKLFEHTFNSIYIRNVDFLLNEDSVYGMDAYVNGRMLDGSNYFIDASYKYDTTTKVLSSGKEMKEKYTFEKLSASTGSFVGSVVFPTIREEEYKVAIDYNLNVEDNAKNEFTLRIYDEKESTESGKYDNISEFLSLYYTGEILYVNAKGLSDYIGEPVELESLHFPYIYLTDLDVSAFLRVAFGYVVRACTLLADYDRETATKLEKETYDACLDAISSSEDLSTIFVTVTEELIKSIRQDDTSMSVLLSRALGAPDNTIDTYFGTNPFQLMTVILSYNFAGQEMGIDVYYDAKEIALFTLARADYEGVILPDGLNDTYYTKFVQPNVITLDYDVSITPYEVQRTDVGKFFGIFFGDSSGQNCTYMLEHGYRLAIRGQVCERRVRDASGNTVNQATVDIKFYSHLSTDKSTENDVLLLSIITNPYNLNELLVGYYMPLGGYENTEGLFYKISKDAVSEELKVLTDEKNIFVTESNLSVLLGLTTMVSSSGNTYIEDGRYCISLMTSETDDPVYDLTGIANTYSMAKIKVSFTELDISGVDTSRYSDPVCLQPEDASIRSIYATGSKWVEETSVYANGKNLVMKLNYVGDSVKVTTGKAEYHPTAYLFGKKITYTVSILETTGTYIIADILATNEKNSATNDYYILKTKLEDVVDEITGVVTSYPQYLFILDPAYNRNLPSSLEVRFDNYETGEANCAIDGFYASNITLSGYNLALIAGEYSSTENYYTLQIGVDSIASLKMSIYLAVLNREVVGYKKDAETLDEKTMAFINGEELPERDMELETQIGDETYTVYDNGVEMTVPVIGVINIDPYTYAMRKLEKTSYDAISENITSAQMKIYFKGYYATVTAQGDGDTEIIRNKYYKGEGYNYEYLANCIDAWKFEPECITWQGGVYYAYGVYGDKEKGLYQTVAIRVNVIKKKVVEVRIDDESNSTYTIDYLIRSTYTIPETGGVNHTVEIVFSDGTYRKLVSMRPAVGSEEYYQQYLLGSLKWNGNDELIDRIKLEGTSSLFGKGKDATSRTTAVLGDDTLGVGTQVIELTVLQPSRYQSADEESSRYVVTKKDVTFENGTAKYEKNNYGQIAISNAKFNVEDEAGTEYAINPYDFTASLPNTVWLYVYRNNVDRIWKNYSIMWQTTDKQGNELYLITEKNGKYTLRFPNTVQEDLVIYGKVGDGNSSIWITMVVRNLKSDLQWAVFSVYSYEAQSVSVGESIEEDYYEFFKKGYARTEDTSFVDGKDYYTRSSQKNSSGNYNFTVYPHTSSVMPVGTTFYELVENDYGLTDDTMFLANKKYYFYVKHNIYTENTPESEKEAGVKELDLTITIDPYLDYSDRIPIEFKAVLGNGAVVTDKTLDDNGQPLGLEWFFINRAVSTTAEYSLIYQGVNEKTDEGLKRYDENGNIIFAYNSGNDCGLKCYIKGSGGIVNEVTLPLAVDSKTIKVNDLNYQYESENKTEEVAYIDLYNNDNNIYVTTEGEASLEKRDNYTMIDEDRDALFTAYKGVNCYKEESSALLARLQMIANGTSIYSGILFSESKELYSLPVSWNQTGIQNAILLLERGSYEVGTPVKGVFLSGTICVGTVNEQKFSIFISIQASALSKVRLDETYGMISDSVYSIVNDEIEDEEQEKKENGSFLTVAELDKLMVAGYNFNSEYKQYTALNENYSGYKNIIYFDISKAYQLSTMRGGTFCTPYEYMCYLFSHLSLKLGNDNEYITANALSRLSLVNTAVAGRGGTKENLIDYFNCSVLGVEDATLIQDGGGNILPYTYSFLSLSGYSEGSAIAQTLIVVRSRRANKNTGEKTETVEIYDENLDARYEEGYPLPTYVDVEYSQIYGGYVLATEAEINIVDGYFLYENNAFTYYTRAERKPEEGDDCYLYQQNVRFVQASGLADEKNVYYEYNIDKRQYTRIKLDVGTTASSYYVAEKKVGLDSFDVSYDTSSWKAQKDSSTSTVFKNADAITKIASEYINASEGVVYNFYYELPCSKDKYTLIINIPRKTIGANGYSAKGDILSITNGVMEINNPFEYITYNTKTEKYEFDKQLVPTHIVPNASGYTLTGINEYDITWTYNDAYIDRNGQLQPYFTSALFEDGLYFCFATCTYSLYSVSAGNNVYREVTDVLKLYLKIAKLEYYGMEKIDDGTLKQENGIQNIIEIDPYASNSGSFALPTSSTILFNSTFDGITKIEVSNNRGTVGVYNESTESASVEYTFGGLLYRFESAEGTSESVQSIPYNQYGIVRKNRPFNQLAEGTTSITLKQRIALGGGKYFMGGCDLVVRILERKIESVQIANKVYYEGQKIKGSYEEVSVDVGTVVTAGMYYECQNGYYFITADTLFKKDKKYYTAVQMYTFEIDKTLPIGKDISSADYYVYVDNRFEKTRDTNVQSGTNYYRIYNADVRSDAIKDGVNTVFYVAKVAFESVLGGQFESGVNYYSLEKAQTFTGKKLACEAYFVKYEGYQEVTQEAFKSGVTYITLAEKTGMGTTVGDNTYCFDTTQGIYALVKSGTPKVANTKYYYVSGTYSGTELPNDGSAVFTAREYYCKEEVYDENGVSLGKTFADRQYYEAVEWSGSDVSNKYYLKNGKYEKSTKATREPQTVYYEFKGINTVTGYAFDQTYFEKVGDRYILTEDLIFSSQKEYFVFIKLGQEQTKTGTTIPSGTYEQFVGYEATSYYANASRQAGAVITSETLPVYYIDPYNPATFRLPTEVNISFSGSDAYKTYTVNGWTLYNEETKVRTPFPVYSLTEDGKTTYYNGSINDAFYAVASGENSRVSHGYYYPQEGDYNGARYLLSGYLLVGEEAQYFYMVVIVLNRSMSLTNELGIGYTIQYDFDDSVGAMLEDIPLSMSEGMFVLYNSYYLSFEIDGVGYTISEGQYLFDYNNGNIPYLPTVKWNQTWQDGQGQEVKFDELFSSGYAGEISGNIFAEDLNFADMFNQYYYDAYASYYVLLNSAMYDKVYRDNESYSGDVVTIVNNKNTSLSSWVYVETYELICNAYKTSVDQKIRQYYTYLTENYVAEIIATLVDTNLKEYSIDRDKEEIVVAMFEAMKAESDNSKDTYENIRIDIYEDWVNEIELFTTEYCTALSSVNDIRAESITPYQRKKASLYEEMEEGGVFGAEDEMKNKSIYAKYSQAITNCVYRDVWNQLTEYASIEEKYIMNQYLQQETNPSETIKKSNALKNILAEYDILPGVKGESTSADITIPAMEYVGLVDSKGNDLTTIQFNIFNYNSIEREYAVKFSVSYEGIYAKKIEEAEKIMSESYMDKWSGAILDELANVLYQKEIDTITPYEIDGVNNVAFLTYNFNSSTYVFTYENYVSTLDMMVKTIDGTIGTNGWTINDYYTYLARKDAELTQRGLPNYYSINTELWNNLYDYYKTIALKPIVNNTTGGENSTTWGLIKSYYNFQSIHTSEELNSPVYIGETKYTDYNKLILEKMKAQNDIVNFDLLKQWVEEYYPMCNKMNEIYTACYAEVFDLVAENLVNSQKDGIYNSVQEKVNPSNKDIAVTEIYYAMYKDATYGNLTFDLPEILTKWIGLRYDGYVDEYGEFINTYEGLYGSDPKKSDKLSYLMVMKGTKELQQAGDMYSFLTTFMLTKGNTPYDALRQDDNIPLTDGLLTELLDVIKNEESFMNMTESIDKLYTWSKDGGKAVSQIYSSADEMKEAYAQYLLFKRLSNVSDISEETSLILAQVTKSSRTKAVQRLLDNTDFSSLKKDLLSFFADPSRSNTSDIYNADYSVPSLAFIVILNEKQQSAEGYKTEKAQLFSDEEERYFGSEAEQILDDLYEKSTTEYTNLETRLADPTSDAYSFYSFYRPLVVSSELGIGSINKKGYELRQNVQATITGETFSVPEVFGAYLLKEEWSKVGTVLANLTDEQKDMAYRAIVTFYKKYASNEQRVIVEEVAKLQSSASFPDNFGYNVEAGKKMFADLLARPDFDESAEEKLYYAYYEEYLSLCLEIISDSIGGTYNGLDSNLVATIIQKMNIGTVLWRLEEGKKDYFIKQRTSYVLSYYKEIESEAFIRIHDKTKTEVLNEICLHYEEDALSVLDYLIKDNTHAGVRGERVKAILEDNNIETFKSESGSEYSLFKSAKDYYKEEYETLYDNAYNEKIDIFLQAFEKGVEEYVFGKMYDELGLFAYTQEKFDKVIYAYFDVATEEKYLEKSKGDLVAFIRDTAKKSDKVVSSSGKWWEQLGATITTVRDGEILNAIYQQKKYTSSKASDLELGIDTLLTVRSLLGNIEKYRDGKLSGYTAWEKGSLTSANILKNDYSEVTVLYKTYYMSALLEERFMSDCGVSLARASLLSAYKSTLLNTARFFDNNVGTDRDNNTYIECIMNGILKEIDQNANPVYSAISESVMTVLGHTSVYALLDLSQQNPLQEYVQRVKIEIEGTGADIDEHKLGNIPIGYYINLYGADYETILQKITEDRDVYVTYYSADHLSTESEEDMLRHVIYFDAGKSEWVEHDISQSSASSTLTEKRVYLTNAYKTLQTIRVADLSDSEYYIHDFTSYLREKLGLGAETEIVFTNAFTKNNLKFETPIYTSIELKFEGEEEKNVISIDPLHPLLKQSVEAWGINEKGTTYLGIISKNISYADIFSQIQTSGGVTIENETAYAVTITADNGMEYTCSSLRVNYVNRVITTMFVSAEDAGYVDTKSTAPVDNPVYMNNTEYYSLALNKKEQYNNVIYINPLDSTILSNNFTSYRLPSTIYVLFGEDTEDDLETFTNVKWDTSNLTYSLEGTGGKYVTTRILSMRKTGEDGTYTIISYTYGANATVTINEYNGSEELDGNGEPIASQRKMVFSLGSTGIDWKIGVKVDDKHATSISADKNNQTVELGTVNEQVVSSSDMYHVIDASQNADFYINQYWPEFPTDITINFNGTNVHLSGLKQSDWSFAQTALNNIVQANSESNTPFTFYTELKYLGYSIKVRFSAFTNVRLADIEETIQGGTLYILDTGESISKQLQNFYSFVYFNFGTAEKPNWMKVPVGFKKSAVDQISDNTIEGVLGFSSTTVNNEAGIDSNIVFRIETVSPKLFAKYSINNIQMYNDYVIYDYYSYAKDSKNERQVALDNNPEYCGDRFLPSANGDVQFVIQSTKYDIINSTAKVTVRYDAKNADSRIAGVLSETNEHLAQYTFDIEIPLYSYLFTDIPSAENLVSFEHEAENSPWTWVDGNKDAVIWPLGRTMRTSDLPKLVVSGSLKTFYAYWDLTGLNVNLASGSYDAKGNRIGGYTIHAYYYTETGKWMQKDLIVYIEKKDISADVTQQITGYRTVLNKTLMYDGTFFIVDLDMEQLTFLRKDGKVEELTKEQFLIEYSLVGSDIWSDTDFPNNAGRYYIRITLDDENCVLTSKDENNIARQYLLLTLVIEAKKVDIGYLTFMYQDVEQQGSNLNLSSTMTLVYNGNARPLTITNWPTIEDVETEQEKSNAYEDIRDRATDEEKAYIDRLRDDVYEKMASMDKLWSEYSGAEKDTKCNAKMYELLQPCSLPTIAVDRWFKTGEKTSMYQDYVEGRGTGAYAGKKLSEKEAKEVCYNVMYNRVNDGAKRQIDLWYSEMQSLYPEYSDRDIKALVYDNFPETDFMLSEIQLHITYQYTNNEGKIVITDKAPSDVGSYNVTVSVVPEENYGNYRSKENITRVMIIEKKSDIVYTLQANSVVYSGSVINPLISDVDNETGILPSDVTIRYTYRYGEQQEYTLVVDRTASGATIVKELSTTGLTQNGIKNAGEYMVTISVNGGKNFISTDASYKSETTFTFKIVPADIFIEVEDINGDYLDSVKELGDFLRVHTGNQGMLCPECGSKGVVSYDSAQGAYIFTCSSCKVGNKNYSCKINISQSADQAYYGGSEFMCGRCGCSLFVVHVNGLYHLACPYCQVEMTVDFSHMTLNCGCDKCYQKTDANTVLGLDRTDTKMTYTLRCVESGIFYKVVLNKGQLLGSDLLSTLGELILSTVVEDYYPTGTYTSGIGGLRLKGDKSKVYTYFGQSYSDATIEQTISSVLANKQLYGDYARMILFESSSENNDTVKGGGYSEILQMFENYNFYVRRESRYYVRPLGDALMAENDEQLKQILYSLGSDAVEIYLRPGDYSEIEIGKVYARDNAGKIVYENDEPVMTEAEVNVTLVGYYDTDKIITTHVAGIKVLRGALTVRILSIDMQDDGDIGIEIGKNAGAVKIYESLLSNEQKYEKTTGVSTDLGYKGKLLIGENTTFRDLGVGVSSVGGDLEINDSIFERNALGLSIITSSDDVRIYACAFKNNSITGGIRSMNKNVVILKNEFLYNRIAVSLPTVKDDNIYTENVFTENDLSTNLVDVEEREK